MTTEERQKQEILRLQQKLLRLGGLLSNATEAAARYQEQARYLEQKLKKVREALR